MLKRIIPLVVPLMAAMTSFSISAQESSTYDVAESEEGAIQFETEDAAEMGSIAFERAISDLPVIANGDEYERVQRIMSRLVRGAARPDIGWRMVLVDSEIPDAWVLPDGKMAIYRGILDRLHDDQEVAALLTHQMAHSLLGHKMFLLGRNEIQTVLMSQDFNVEGTMREQLAYSLGASIADGVQVMPYSRMMETEADDLAMVMMLKAGYDPAATIGTWQWLSDESRFAMEYLSAHPSTTWRIEQMQEQMPCYHKAFEETWGHKPVGLEEQPRDSTISCPPFVTGVMSEIKRDHRSGEKYVYDWDDEPGYEAAYYDHVRYHSRFYDDPYYNAWNRGRVSYSFGFRFGGFSYYRWSPFWTGWTYYDPWRPTYVFRIGRGHNHYVNHPQRRSYKWRRHSVKFRNRNYTRNDYYEDERRFRTRKHDRDGDYDREDRRRREGRRSTATVAKRTDIERDRAMTERKFRSTGGNRPQAVERDGKIISAQPKGTKKYRARDIDGEPIRSRPLNQPRRDNAIKAKRLKNVGAESEKAINNKVRASRNQPKVRVMRGGDDNPKRKGVMEFREQSSAQPQRQPKRSTTRVERNKKVTNQRKTYTSPKRERYEVERQPNRQTSKSQRQRRQQEAAPVRNQQRSAPAPQRQNASQPPRQQKATPQPRRQQYSKPKEQSYKPPKPSSAKPSSDSASKPSSSSSKKPSRKSRPKNRDQR